MSEQFIVHAPGVSADGGEVENDWQFELFTASGPVPVLDCCGNEIGMEVS